MIKFEEYWSVLKESEKVFSKYGRVTKSLELVFLKLFERLFKRIYLFYINVEEFLLVFNQA